MKEKRGTMGRLYDLIQEHIDAQAPYRPSSRRVAMELGVTQTTLNNWREPKKLIDKDHLVAIARLTRNPYRVVLDALLEDIGYLHEGAEQRHVAPLEPIEPKVMDVIRAQADALGVTVEEYVAGGVQSRGQRGSAPEEWPRHGLEDLDDPTLTREQRIQILERVGLTQSEAATLLDARVGDPEYAWASRMRNVIARSAAAGEDLALAARRNPSRGRQMRAEQDAAGEESQDDRGES